MSNSTTPSVSRSTSEPQPDTASRASVWRSMISSVEPGLAPDAREELLAVLGGAAGLGGDQPRAADRRGRAACRRRPSAPRRRGPSPRRPAGRWPPAPRPADDARKGVDDAELARTAGHRDQQPAIVGAEIERGEHRQVVGLCRAGALSADPAISETVGRGGLGNCLRLRQRTLPRRCLAARTPSRAKTLRPRLRLRRLFPLPFGC